MAEGFSQTIIIMIIIVSYLFQRLSVIIQHFNSVLIQESFVSADEELDF